MRIQLLDFLRGVAVIGMVIFHWIFIEVIVGLATTNIFSPSLVVFQKSVFLLFIEVSAILLGIQYKNKYHKIEKKYFYLQKIWRLLIPAIVITLITSFIIPAATIYFGILHFFGFAYLITIFLLHRLPPKGMFAIALLLVALQFVTKQIHLETLVFVPFGIAPQLFQSVDYVPLIPWLGFYILGVLFGLSNKIDVVLAKVTYQPNLFTRSIEYIGRHSLQIYCIHVPIIIFCMYLLFLLGLY